jgi:hypothetical protein
MNAEEQFEERTLWTVLGPAVYNIVALLMNIAFAAAALAALYLLFGMFSGNLNTVTTLPVADRTRLLGIVDTASQIVLWGTALGALSAALITWGEETAGYVILAGAAALAFAVPFAFATFGGQNQSGEAVARALVSFRNASYIPGLVGGALVVLDVIKRFSNAFQSKQVNPEIYTYGADAAAEPKPLRMSLFGKCWEGPYCRDSIRPHCPIFQERKACWRERRGCYCEEEIVTKAAEKVQGIVLGMAPDPKRNYANSPTPGVSGQSIAGIGGATGRGPELTIGGTGVVSLNQEFGRRRVELTMAEKIERCRNCVIYNEHQKEKYQLLLPVAIIGGLLLCFLFSGLMREFIGTGFSMADALLAKISFKAGDQQVTTFGKPNDFIGWGIVIAIALMVVSKLLQILEWACFKAKI